MSWIVGINISESFAELIATNGQEKHVKRWYTPQIPISTFLTDFFSAHPEIKASRVTITSRFIEKILDRKLGGSVATLTTSGFENWAWIRQPITQNQFDLVPQRLNPITNEELIFGLTERTRADGSIEQAIIDSELEFLESKFKLMEVKRVCINLLHSQANPENEKRVGNYFREKGFQVFLSHELTDCKDEVPRWRRNLLNAGIAGVFEDLLSEIKKGTKGAIPEDQIYFWSADGSLFQNDGNQYLSSLFGFAPCLHRYISSSLKTKDQDYSILHFGLELFTLINPFAKKNTWNTVWGPVELSGLHIQRLCHQPTTEIVSYAQGLVSFSSHDIGFEPGPMCFGKSQKPTLFDLMIYLDKIKNIDGVSDKISSVGLQRLESTFLAMIKNSKDSHMNVEEFTERLWKNFINRLAQEIALNDNYNKICITGTLASALAKDLEKLLSYKKIIFTENYEHEKVSPLLLGAYWT